MVKYGDIQKYDCRNCNHYFTINRYLEQIKPKVSGAWRADELYVRIRGNPKYLFALMDDENGYAEREKECYSLISIPNRAKIYVIRGIAFIDQSL